MYLITGRGSATAVDQAYPETLELTPYILFVDCHGKETCLASFADFEVIIMKAETNVASRSTSNVYAQTIGWNYIR